MKRVRTGRSKKVSMIEQESELGEFVPSENFMDMHDIGPDRVPRGIESEENKKTDNFD